MCYTGASPADNMPADTPVGNVNAADLLTTTDRYLPGSIVCDRRVINLGLIAEVAVIILTGLFDPNYIVAGFEAIDPIDASVVRLASTLVFFKTNRPLVLVPDPKGGNLGSHEGLPSSAGYRAGDNAPFC
jgi:hypothetical protein